MYLSIFTTAGTRFRATLSFDGANFVTRLLEKLKSKMAGTSAAATFCQVRTYLADVDGGWVTALHLLLFVDA
jgi:hypothetical protein